MRFSARYLFAILLTTLSLPTLLAAQSAGQQTSKTPRGSVSGRVTIKEKGVAGVVVGLRKNEMIIPFEPYQKATTDPDGFYRIANIAPGNYEIVPSAPAYVMANIKDGKSKQILVGDDENVEGVNFSLDRGGVITGRVTDADGRPVIQQQVYIYQENAFKQPGQQPPRPIFPVTNVQTDDRGIYRVYGLQAGRYKVGAGRSDDTFTSGGNTGRSSYLQVFYGDATEQDKAKVIEVTEGSEATGIDIDLGRPQQTFMAGGRVVDSEKGMPVSNIRFALQRNAGQRYEYVNTLAVSNSQGDFVVEGLVPGKYAVTLLQTQNQPSEMRAEAVNFEIIDQDVSGVIIKLSQGSTVSGVVVIETEDKAVLARLIELQVRGFVAMPGGGVVSSSSFSPVASDGSFRLPGLGSGLLILNISTATRPLPPKGFTIARIERDGVVAQRGIEVKDGEQVTGVRVVLSYGSAVIRGTVTLENGPLPEGTRISVALTKPGEHNSSLRPPVVDQRGRFLIEDVPAGTYELTTFIGSGATPQTPMRMFKRVLTVQEGSTTDVTIEVDLTPPPRP